MIGKQTQEFQAYADWGQRSDLTAHQSYSSLEGIYSCPLLYIIYVASLSLSFFISITLSLSYAICYMGMRHALHTPDGLLGGSNSLVAAKVSSWAIKCCTNVKKFGNIFLKGWTFRTGSNQAHKLRIWEAYTGRHIQERTEYASLTWAGFHVAALQTPFQQGLGKKQSETQALSHALVYWIFPTLPPPRS